MYSVAVHPFGSQGPEFLSLAFRALILFPQRGSPHLFSQTTKNIFPAFFSRPFPSTGAFYGPLETSPSHNNLLGCKKRVLKEIVNTLQGGIPSVFSGTGDY